MGQSGEQGALKCIYANLQSLFSKKSEIEITLQNSPVDVMLFSEIWISEEHHDAELFIKGFQKPFVDPQVRGGACGYIRNGIDFMTVNPPHPGKQSIWFTIKTKVNLKRLYC